jgi:phytoene dehydrogenase-like protein
MAQLDAVVVGSGPNGLVAAIILARAGLAVEVWEAKETWGGGLRSMELTLPGFVHDVCAAVMPMAVVSPILRQLLAGKIHWLYPDLALAHPFENGDVATLSSSVLTTAQMLGKDASKYPQIFEPLVASSETLWAELLAPLHFPQHPLQLLRFGILGMQSAVGFAHRHFVEAQTQALFAGLAAHAFLPLSNSLTAAMGLVLGVTAHAPGWPYPQGGAQSVTHVLVEQAQRLGVVLRAEHTVERIEQLPRARLYLFDVSPQQLAALATNRFTPAYCAKLRRYHYGPSAFKIDWALSDPIPWCTPACSLASTVHIAGSMEEIAAAEAQITQGTMPEKPFILVAQPSLIDKTRAPSGKHTAWAYAHVPHAWPGDATTLIEARIATFAPGFRDTILARHVFSTAALERYNPNNIGGHIIGGVADVSQLFRRPISYLRPYNTPDPKIFLCSASTPPGAGIHGMCGYHAAKAALKTLGLSTDL